MSQAVSRQAQTRCQPLRLVINSNFSALSVSKLMFKWLRPFSFKFTKDFCSVNPLDVKPICSSDSNFLRPPKNIRIRIGNFVDFLN